MYRAIYIYIVLFAMLQCMPVKAIRTLYLENHIIYYIYDAELIFLYIQ